MAEQVRENAAGERLPAIDECSYCGELLTDANPCPARGMDDAPHRNYRAEMAS